MLNPQFNYLIAASTSTSLEEEKTEKKVRRRKTKKKDDSDVGDQGNGAEVSLSDHEESTFIANVEGENEEDTELEIEEGEDISYTYDWPPLVCCFGAAQHAFVPSGRPANRLLDYEIHERMKDAFWAPENFVRAPGGSAGSVAIALATLGGKVAFMGKLGDDIYGRAMLYYLNLSSVQTRSVRIDSKRVTAVSQMKIGKRGNLRMTCVKPCAEDSLSKSEINIDVLKEVQDFSPVQKENLTHCYGPCFEFLYLMPFHWCYNDDFSLIDIDLVSYKKIDILLCIWKINERLLGYFFNN